MLRSISKQSGESYPGNHVEKRLQWAGFAEKEGFKPEMKG